MSARLNFKLDVHPNMSYIAIYDIEYKELENIELMVITLMNRE